ncbi:MAG: RsmD family RNA methyltransferase, partial [Planctomycetota bacterium]
MRVLSGSARSVPLKTVPDFGTRPILDRLKKSLFSILDSMSLIVDARVADLYAGTGTLGIEALSRGAEHCLFVEKRSDAVQLLHENLAKTKLAAKAEVR